MAGATERPTDWAAETSATTELVRSVNWLPMMVKAQAETAAVPAASTIRATKHAAMKPLPPGM